MRRRFLFLALIVACAPTAAGAQAQGYLGNWSANPHAPGSTANPFGAGSPFAPNGIANRHGPIGNSLSDRSVTSPYATNAPRLYDEAGNYRGKLSANKYDPESIANPYGRYGSPYSPDSVNNPFGPGSRFSPDSPFNRHGKGLSIFTDRPAAPMGR